MVDCLQALYHLRGPPSEATSRAQELCVEQTLEYPPELASPHVRERCLARVLELRELEPDCQELRVGFPVEIVLDRHGGVDHAQLLNVLFGNISLKPGVRLVDFVLPPHILGAFPGPRLGANGLFERAGIERGPLVGTALKPMGQSPRELASLAGECARGGIDLLKDDHGICDQPFSPFLERVTRVVEALREASVHTGRRCLYFPNVTAMGSLLEERVEQAAQAGADGLVLSVGLTGLHALLALACAGVVNSRPPLPILAHPALVGAFTVHPDHGVAPGLLLGGLYRLLGADGVIFPSHIGRFGTPTADCRDIMLQGSRALPGIRTLLPVPAGGMRLQDLPEIVEFYGERSLLLIGGDLHRHGDLRSTCARFVEQARRAGAPAES